MRSSLRLPLLLLPFLPTVALEAGPTGEQGSPAPVVEEGVRREMESSFAGRAHVIVVLREPPVWTSAVATERRLLVRSLQESVLRGFTDGEFEIAYRYRNFPAFTGWIDAAGLQKLATHPLVAAVGPDARGEMRLDSSRPYLGADRVESELSITGQGATVILPDSGVDTGHPDLADSVAAGAFHFLAQGTDIGPGAEDDLGHGTAVSGIITSNGTVAPRGIAPGADILAIKVISSQGEVTASDANAAADYAASIKDQYEHLVAMNYSLGFYFEAITLPEPCPCDSVTAASRSSQMALQAAKDAGILTFGASGNTGSCGPNGQMGYPQCVTACVAVGAVHDVDVGRVPSTGTFFSNCAAEFGAELCRFLPDCFDAATVPDTPACFMDRTRCTQLLAPAWDIVTTEVGGGRTLGYWGTSFASPHAAAVAALLAGRCLSPDQVLEIMRATGRRVPDGCPSDSHEVTIIDAFAAVAAAEASYPLCTDCNRNLVPDTEDLSSGASRDCNANGVLDECEPGCNHNGVPDECDIASGASADCNGNGIPDECDVAPQDFSLHSPTSVTVGANLSEIGLADLDADRSADILALSLTPRALVVLFGRPGGTFLEPLVIATGEPHASPIAADLNGDGLLDIAAAAPGMAASPGSEILVITSGPGRTFSKPRRLPAGRIPRAVIAADLDADGDTDLASLNEGSADITVVGNLGPDGFAAPASHAAQTGSGFLAAADWDGDGDLDLLAAYRGASSLSVFANDGRGAFAAAAAVDIRSPPASFRAADLNGDGLSDVVMGDASSRDVSVLLNSGDGILGEAVHHDVWPGPVPILPAHIITTDLDGDGAVDIVTANTRIDTVSVFLNNGEGAMRPPLQFEARDSPRFLAAARLKARAGLDLVVLGATTAVNRLEILFNRASPAASLDDDSNGRPDECELRFRRGDCDGDGEVTGVVTDAIFILGFNFLGGARPSCMAACDANGDGTVTGVVTDAIYLLGHNFLGGPAPPPPFPACGQGNDDDEALGCALSSLDCATGP